MPVAENEPKLDLDPAETLGFESAFEAALEDPTARADADEPPHERQPCQLAAGDCAAQSSREALVLRGPELR
jgi:hypothetical protein